MKRLWLVLIVVLLIAGSAYSSTFVAPTFGPVFNSTGQPLNGGLLYTISPGGTWPSNAKATYSNKAMTVANTNPVVLGAYGTAAVYGAGQYKLWLTDTSGNTIWTIDQVDGIGTSTNFVSISSYGNNLHTAISSIGSTPTTLLIDQPITLTATDTIPSTLVILVVKTTAVNITMAGYSLTWNSPFTPVDFQVFTGTGNIVFGTNALLSAPPPVMWGGSTAGATAANVAAVNIIGTLIANSATPDISTFLPVYETNNSQSTTITNFSNKVRGQSWKVIVNDTFTTINFGVNIKGHGGIAWTAPQGAVIDCTSDGTLSYCTDSDHSTVGSSTPVSSNFGSLTIQNDATTPNTKLDITAATVQVTNGTIYQSLSNVSTSVNFLLNGAAGELDTGALTATDWYYLYVIYDGTNVSGLGSLSSTSPTMPPSPTLNAACTAAGVPSACCTGLASGNCIYTYKNLVGEAYAVNLNTYCTASTQPYACCTGSGTGTCTNPGFAQYVKNGNFAIYDDYKQVATASSSQNWAVESCTAFVPPTSTRGWFQVSLNSSGSPQEATMSAALRKNGSGSANGHDMGFVGYGVYPGYVNTKTNDWCDTDASQNVQLYISTNTGSWTWYLRVLGYETNY